jgi:hypothetical protein
MVRDKSLIGWMPADVGATPEIGFNSAPVGDSRRAARLALGAREVYRLTTAGGQIQPRANGHGHASIADLTT